MPPLFRGSPISRKNALIVFLASCLLFVLMYADCVISSLWGYNRANMAIVVVVCSWRKYLELRKHFVAEHLLFFGEFWLPLDTFMWITNSIANRFM